MIVAPVDLRKLAHRSRRPVHISLGFLADNFSTSCITNVLTAAEPHIIQRPTILRSSIIEQRRSRVNVNGVVTPSPVGPAMEKET